MDLTVILEFIFSTLFPILFVLIIVYLISKRMIHTMKAHLGMKKFVKESIKKDRKKFNGLQLVDTVKRKRKRHTNTYQHLRMRGKRLVKKYFVHKAQELPVFVRYAKGKLLKRSRSSIRILVKQGKKTVGKYPLKQGPKHLIACTNDHTCLNELITFLHHLPDAVLEQRPYDLYVPSSDTTITYQIK